jgi:hypothetical protein
VLRCRVVSPALLLLPCRSLLHALGQGLLAGGAATKLAIARPWQLPRCTACLALLGGRLPLPLPPTLPCACRGTRASRHGLSVGRTPFLLLLGGWRRTSLVLFLRCGRLRCTLLLLRLRLGRGRRAAPLPCRLMRAGAA